MAAWLSGSALVSLNEVYSMLSLVSTGMGDRLRAGKPPRFVTSHSGQLSLLPSAEGKISTGQSAVTLCGWEVKAGMVHSICGCTSGWQVKRCDLSLTRVISERFRYEFFMIKRYTSLRLLYFTLLYFRYES